LPALTRSRTPDPFMDRDSPEVEAERGRREALLAALRERADPRAAPPPLIKQLGIQVGQQGIFRDLPNTRHLAPSGVALSVRHTGSSYADDLSDDAVIYHYPRTSRPGRDVPEIEALKAAQRLALPVFVIVNDPLNGLVLCMNHHRAVDAGILRIRPESGEFVDRDDSVVGLERLGVTVPDLSGLRHQPHADALRWLWGEFAER
jgi:hypothetical protein